MQATTNRRVLVTLATYNEIKNLPRLVDAIFVHAPEVDVLVIDDNSPDGTGTWAEQRAATDARVHCIVRLGKLGLGTAIVAGMQYAIAQGYDYVLNMDADFSHGPEYLPSLIAAAESSVNGHLVDVAIGSRYTPGGGVQEWPLMRRLMSRGVNLYARWFLWLTPQDCSGSYRCYRTSTLAKLDFSTILSTGYSFQEEILWLLRRIGARFVEVPIVFIDRREGVSKINSQEAWYALRIIGQLGLSSLLPGGGATNDPAPPSIKKGCVKAPHIVTSKQQARVG